jgi:hypothetical protein
MPPENQIRKRLLYDTAETCELLGIKPKCVYSLVKRGLLKRHPSVRKLLIPYQELERFAGMALLN